MKFFMIFFVKVLSFSLKTNNNQKQIQTILPPENLGVEFVNKLCIAKLPASSASTSVNIQQNLLQELFLN